MHILFLLISSVPESTAGHGSPLRSSLNLQLRTHATPKLPVQECPMCPYSSESISNLEEHINRQHFDLTSPSVPPDSPPLKDSTFNCPFCVTAFPKSSDLELHVNIEHKDILRYYPLMICSFFMVIFQAIHIFKYLIFHQQSSQSCRISLLRHSDQRWRDPFMSSLPEHLV